MDVKEYLVSQKKESHFIEQNYVDPRTTKITFPAVSYTHLDVYKRQEYIGTNRVVCLNSATACLEMTLRLLGIGPGDEVITTAYTYTASASVVEHVGAKLVLVDVAKDSYEIDYEKLADAITERCV